MDNLKTIIDYINKIDLATIKKGKRLFEHGYVSFDDKKDDTLIFNCRSESNRGHYRVKIALQNLAESSCACPAFSAPYPCKHITACLIETKNSNLIYDVDNVNFSIDDELKFTFTETKKEEEWLPLNSIKINIWDYIRGRSNSEISTLRTLAVPHNQSSVFASVKENETGVTLKYNYRKDEQEINFKAKGHKIFSTCTCDTKLGYGVFCKHKVVSLMLLNSLNGEDYFFKFIDFTEEKNRLLADYGLTMNDEDASLFKFKIVGDTIKIEAKNNNILKPQEWTWLRNTASQIKEAESTSKSISNISNLADNIIVWRNLASYPGIKIDIFPLITGTVENPVKIGTTLVPKSYATLDSFKKLVFDEAEFAFNLHYEGIDNYLKNYCKSYRNYYSLSLSNLVNLSGDEKNSIGNSFRDNILKHAAQLNQKHCVYWDESNSGKINISKLQPLHFAEEGIKLKISIKPKNNFLAVNILAIINETEHVLKSENIINNALIKLDNNIYAVADEKQFSLLWEFKNKPEILIPVKDANSMIRNYIMPLKSIVDVDIDEIFSPKIEVANTFEKNIRISDLAPDFLLLEAYFKYNELDVTQGTNQVETVVDVQTIIIDRNIPEERGHIAFLSTLHPKFPSQINRGFFFLKFSEALHNNWFFDTMKLLEENNIKVYGKNDLKLFKYNPNKAKFEMKAGSGIDWFDVKIELSFGDDIVPIADLRKAVIEGQEYILLGDGTMGVLPQEWIQKLKAIFKIGKTDKDSNSVQLSKLHFTLIDELSDNFNDEKLLFELSEKKRRLAEINTNKNYELPKNLIAELRPYQQSGYQWFNLLHEMGWGGCLADDMGLGKTLQAITFIQKRVEDTTVETEFVVIEPEEKPEIISDNSIDETQIISEETEVKKAKKTIVKKKKGKTEIRLASPIRILIVGPTSLVYNWENEFKKFAPEIKYYIHHGSERGTLEQSFSQDWNVCITSYGTMRNDIEQFIKITFDVMVLDESQAIKNADAQLSKAVKLVPAKQRFIMSGTPVQNNTFDLYAQFDFINPQLLGNKEFFKTEFANAIDKNADAQRAEQLRKMVFPFLLRRTKETVAKDLPAKIESVIYCEMDTYQRKIYEQVKDEYRAKILQKVSEEGVAKTAFLILEGLTKLRMLCDSPSLVRDAKDVPYKAESIKLEELTREIEENISNHKILVFSQFLGMLDLVRKRLDKDNVKYLYLDGSTPATERQNLVKKFQEDDSIQIFLMSLKAGGVGLTLTAADYVYIVDPWWNPAVEDQAIDRTHRIGQNKAIFAYKMICKDSIEEKIVQLQEKKKSIAKELISEDAGFVKKLTKEDLEFLFM